jgi:hypothetical protein
MRAMAHAHTQFRIVAESPQVDHVLPRHLDRDVFAEGVGDDVQCQVDAG